MVACHGEGSGLGLAGGHPSSIALVGVVEDHNCFIFIGVGGDEGDHTYISTGIGANGVYRIYVINPGECTDLLCTAVDAAVGQRPCGQLPGGQGMCATPQTP